MAEEGLIDLSADPYDLFGQWLYDAEQSEPNDHNAMTLASADAKGRASARMVLLKGWEPHRFIFYTNYDSRKGQDLQANAYAALLFHWKTLRRQIRIEGRVETVSDTEADAYFASRPRASQIGAWASNQSQEMEGRLSFEKNIAKFTAKFAIGAVPRPPRWSGFCVVPERIEFWQDRKFRLHDRVEFLKQADIWITRRLYP